MKMKMSGVAIAAVVAALFLALPPSHNPQAATAPDLTCTGTQTGGTFNNVAVPPGDTCTLVGARILGNVNVEAGAALGVDNSSATTTIAGNITAKGCDYINLTAFSSTTNRIVIGGNVTIENCTGIVPTGTFNAVLAGTSPPTLLVGGNVTCQNNNALCFVGETVIGQSLDCSGNQACQLVQNAVGKNVTIDNNTGGALVLGHVISGNLACSGNTPGVGNGSPPNTVAGTESGQCAGL